MIADQPADFALQRAMVLRTRRHRDRLAIDEFPQPAGLVAGVPAQELIDGHAGRNRLANCNHVVTLAPAAAEVSRQRPATRPPARPSMHGKANRPSPSVLLPRPAHLPRAG